MKKTQGELDLMYGRRRGTAFEQGVKAGEPGLMKPPVRAGYDAAF